MASDETREREAPEWPCPVCRKPVLVHEVYGPTPLDPSEDWRGVYARCRNGCELLGH